MNVKFTKFGFQLGLDRPLEIREERIREHAHPCRVAYISDIHLRRGRTRRLCDQGLEAIEQARPDLVLLGGDLVDQSSELGALRQLIMGILKWAPVFAIPGNHDVAVGEELVRHEVLAAGAHWLAGQTVDFYWENRIFSISGPGSSPSLNADVRVLCAHNPRIWKSAREAGYDLVLAGHLHGCQGVLFEAAGRLYPGAVFYRYNYIRDIHQGTRLVVSMGCSDLIPVRWGCPREIVLCIV